jgi:hypothetical protein
MSNRILNVLVEDRSLNPLSAELWVTVRPEKLTVTSELRGRLMGPSCHYANTVEIAYPLLPLQRPEIQEPGTLRSRVIISEASLWDPQSPFLYSGPIELWEDGQCWDRVQILHGLRRLTLGSQGLRINGKLTPIVGQSVPSLNESAALALRGQGCNLLLIVLREETAFVWEMADRLGFLVLGRVSSVDVRSLDLLLQLSQHPCCMGWVLPPGDVPGRKTDIGSVSLIGCEAVVDGIDFQISREDARLILRAGGVTMGRIQELKEK